MKIAAKCLGYGALDANHELTLAVYQSVQMLALRFHQRCLISWKHTVLFYDCSKTPGPSTLESSQG